MEISKLIIHKSAKLNSDANFGLIIYIFTIFWNKSAKINYINNLNHHNWFFRNIIANNKHKTLRILILWKWKPFPTNIIHLNQVPKENGR